MKGNSSADNDAGYFLQNSFRDWNLKFYFIIKIFFHTYIFGERMMLGPYEKGESSKNGEARSGKVFQVAQNLREKLYPATAETGVALYPCAENHICDSRKGPVSNSTTSLHSCSCGPDCGPDKCSGRQKTSLVSWDANRTKIFLLLIAIFAIWLLVYIPFSVTS